MVSRCGHAWGRMIRCIACSRLMPMLNGFHLALVDAENGCPDRLGHVGGKVQGQADDGGGKASIPTKMGKSCGSP